ncbi:LysR substrate-binding domain-containing protein [Acidovorax sp. LjRoot118]|uniref:LysR substrate-binding domain-containing protein n=1 Tax=unclassified Acidovorax TaxID=2684926 RepID=UPI00070ED850|nr:LysR substrate-binding domain-containing protein [Acidovorax sp. Root217]KRC23272.1 LysR family transcriptional regulator [Acidovorax sp. Root217]
MRDLDLTTLRLFVAVCEARNIARAAQLHHIVPSAISKRLALLEQTVGNTLIERRRRGVVPTGAGEILLEHARAMLAAADRVGRDMAAYGNGITGQVRILATVSSIAEFLPDDIASFLQVPAHRDIRIDIEEAVSSELVRGLREGAVPVGVCWDAADLAGLQTRSYRRDHLAIVAPLSHPLARRRRCAFEDTLGFDQVGLPASTAVHTMLARAAAIIGRPINYRAVVSTFDASMRCVRAGLGIAVVPREVAEPVAATLGIRVLPLTDDWAQRRFAICFNDEKRLSPAARMLVEHLHQVAHDEAQAAG